MKLKHTKHGYFIILNLTSQLKNFNEFAKIGFLYTNKKFKIILYKLR